MRNKICKAILNKNIIKINYDSKEERVIEPYCYGLGNSENFLLRAFQLRGFSNSGKNIGWKLLKVDKISNIIFLPEKFSIRIKEYNPEDPAMAEIICNVKA